MNINEEDIRNFETTPLGIVPDLTSPKPPAGTRHHLLFVGRCERRKGVHVLLNVLPEILKNHQDWECHMVGDDQGDLVEGGTLKQKFLEKHKDAEWLPRVIFHGIVTEECLLKHYRTCDLFIAPSLFESFGLIYHEAMQYGKAVIGCHTGGIPEVVEQKKEGLLVKPDDTESLKDAIEELISNDKLRQSMGKAAAERVHKTTNYKTMARNLTEVYLKTIDRTGKQS